jgi:predicted ATPase
MLAAMDRLSYVTELTLERLKQPDMALMLQAIFSLASPAKADFLDALHGLTQGNPLFVEEVLKSLIAAGDIYQVSGEWTRKPLTQLRIPRTVQVAVQQRTHQLSQGALELLTLAAVAGQRFDLRVLQAIMGQPEAELLRQLRELRAAQLVSEESDETFVFRHALTRQAIYGELLARERRVRHRAIAEVLEGGIAGPPELRAGELALHSEEAGLWEPALSWAQRAGAQAQALYAYAEVLSHFERARRCAEALARPELVARVDRTIGGAYFSGGQFAQAIEPFERALAATGDPAMRAAVKADLGGSYANIGDERGWATCWRRSTSSTPRRSPRRRPAQRCGPASTTT